MRQQRYPVPNRRGTAPEADLTARSLNETASLPAHISTRITRFLSLRNWTVNTNQLDANLRARRQCIEYTELRPIGEWQDQLIAACSGHVSTQHNGVTFHHSAELIVDATAAPDNIVTRGTIGDGELAAPTVSFNPSGTLPNGIYSPSSVVDVPLPFDALYYLPERYAWLTRASGCFNLAGADLQDADWLASRNAVATGEQRAKVIGATPTQTAPRCAGLTARIFPTGATTTSTALAQIRATACSYAIDP